MFLAKDGIYAKMAYPKIIFVSSNNGNYFLDKIYRLRDFFERRIALFYFDKEQFSIISAMMLGDTDLMQKDLKDKLKFSGLSHIIAISGSHIVIFSEIIISLCLFLKISKKKAIYFAMFFAWLFIIFSGFAMSAVRSGIMGGIYLLSKVLNRQSAFLTNFLFALAIILAFNPILLIYDIGLQLSFASIAGIVYLTDFFAKKLFFIPKLGFLDLRNIMAMTISAQIATLGIVVYHFSEFYPLGIIANLLVIPIAYYLMFCSLFFIIFASVWTWLGYIFYFPTLFFLSYFQSILNIFYITKNIKVFYTANLIFVFVFYGILGYTIYRLEEDKRDLIFSK
jgi:competence protein ComEC